MENINFELYKVFYYVAKNKNLTRAAEALFISQPAITQSIKKLEEQIGHTLFYRTKHGMSLTNEGEILFEYLKNPIECLQNGKRKIEEAEEEIDTIRIGGGTTVLQHNLLKPLQSFKEKYPKIQFVIKHDMSKNLLDMLTNKELDIVILTGTPLTKEDLLFLPIEEMKERFVANTKNFQIYQEHLFQIKDLNELPLILQSPSSSTRAYMDKIVSKEHSNLHATYELASYGLVIEFVKAGLGIGFININRVKQELKNKQLFILNTTFEIPNRYVYVVIHKSNFNHPLFQKFIEYLKEGYEYE